MNLGIAILSLEPFIWKTEKRKLSEIKSLLDSFDESTNNQDRLKYVNQAQLLYTRYSLEAPWLKSRINRALLEYTNNNKKYRVFT